jgi:hypothetical protein
MNREDKIMVRSILSNSFIVLAIAACGCNPTGPATLRTGRGSYNVAIQRTNNEQLLLNLVRLRYRDTPYFMEVASVSTSFEFTSNATASASIPESADRIYDLGAGISFSEQPTVTYTPLQGDEFVMQLMSPVDLNTLLLLYHSGWSIERIFRVCLQSINGLQNAPNASGPTPDRVPLYKEFLEVTKILRDLQVKRAIDMGQTVTDSNESVVELRITQEDVDSQQVTRLCELLRLEKGRNSFGLATGVSKSGRDLVAVTTRSLMASLFYISQSVEPPPKDQQAGRVTVTRDSSGNEFDWREVTGGLIQINSCSRKPENAYAAIHYRGSWFYIDDSDLTSKSTFSLLTQLFALQAGDIKSTGPILTLPVTH